MAEHTKLPWEFRDGSIVANGQTLKLVGVEIPMVVGASRLEAIKNAALIVKAVNSHKSALEMLREAALQLEYMQTKTPTGTSAAVLARINHFLSAVGGPCKP